jgi:hypothetical protein
MKRQLEAAIEAPPKFETLDGAKLKPELLNAPDLQDAPELLTANEAVRQAPIFG